MPIEARGVQRVREREEKQPGDRDELPCVHARNGSWGLCGVNQKNLGAIGVQSDIRTEIRQQTPKDAKLNCVLAGKRPV